MSLQGFGCRRFLIVASTLVGYAVFLALNRGASPILANSFNYAAPVIALALSAWLLGEPVGWGKAAAAGATLIPRIADPDSQCLPDARVI